MFRVLDSRTLSRTLAAIGLIAGPLLFFLDTLIDPAWAEDDAAYLAEIAAHRNANITAEVVATLGSLVLIPGTIGVMRLMRGRRITLGQAAAGLVTIGLIGITASLPFNLVDVAMADFENRDAMVALRGDLEESGAISAYWLFFFVGGFVCGSILLAIALLRRRIVSIWSPILLIVATVLLPVMGGERLWSAVSLVILAAAFAPLAMLIWSLSDDDWEQWALPLDGRAVGSEDPARLAKR